MPDLVSLAWETTATTGTGTINLSGTSVAGYLTLQASGCVDSTSYEYAIHDGNQTETGEGTFGVGSPSTFSRDTIIASTNGGAALNLSGAATIMITPSHKHFFPKGTKCLFQQTSAPLGWTKDTTHNDKALRVVSGTASSGGTNSFSTVMAQTVVGSTTISTATMPGHAHTVTDAYNAPASGFGGLIDLSGSGIIPTTSTVRTTSSVGSGGSHNHTISMDIAYVDIIIATKD